MKKSYIIENKQALEVALKFIGKKQFEEAKKILTNLSMDGVEVKLAEIRLMKSNVKAISGCKEILDKQPDHLATMAYLASLYAIKKDEVKAKQLLLDISGRSVDDYFFWINIAQTLSFLCDYNLAISCVERALKYDQDYMDPWFLKGHIHFRLGNLNAAIQVYNRILSYLPLHQPSLINLAVSYGRTGKHEISSHYQKIAKLSGPNNHYLNLMEAHHELKLGDIIKGFDLYRTRHNLNQVNTNFIASADMLKESSQFKGKTICVETEQGSGDNIQFSRYLNLLTDTKAEITFVTPKLLHPLFKKNFPKARVITRHFKSGTYDYSISLLDLPYVFEAKQDEIPSKGKYLSAPKKHQQKWQKIIKKTKGLKIGFSWKGSNLHANNNLRSMAVEDFIPLFNCPGTDWFSLQVNSKNELPKCDNLHDFTDQLNNFADTAALIEQLDLVVSVDSAPVHLGGALGKKTFALLAYDPDWRWRTERTDSYWYSSVQLIRQNDFRNWSSVINKVQKQIVELEQYKKQ